MCVGVDVDLNFADVFGDAIALLIALVMIVIFMSNASNPIVVILIRFFFDLL